MGENIKKLVLNKEKIQEVKNIGNGVFFPLKGFLKERDFKKVISEMRLNNGEIFPIPIVLDISEKERKEIEREKDILLVDKNQKQIAILKEIEIYSFDKDFLAENIFMTKDKSHPGVRDVYKMKEFLVGGEIELLDRSKDFLPEYYFTPEETKIIFREAGWKTICGFQTRNIPHYGHEFLIKKALKKVDGVFIQPIIGKKKIGDFKDEYILISYEILINHYLPKEKIFLGILPLKMRYAGPREALFHAIIRRNFGCTHFIVGRDHAGVRNYYKPYEAQKIFNNFKKEELGIEILKFPEVVWWERKKVYAFFEKCPQSEAIVLSGSKLREYIQKKQNPPEYFIRSEIFNFLVQSENVLVDEIYLKEMTKKGFVLWCTGLPQSGKTTIANGVYQILKEKGLKVEKLDGDIIRKTISRGLGFSKKDREENLRRVGKIAALLSKNGFAVICSFISPYRKIRKEIREKVENFIEVFCNCPLEICEKRDKKGLYQKARLGKIQNFTGISDPYEPPQNPEIELKTNEETIAESVEKIIRYLRYRKFI